MKKCVAVFGAGLSGQSVAKLAQSEGHTVTVFDENTECRNNFTQSDVTLFSALAFQKIILGESFSRDMIHCMGSSDMQQSVGRERFLQ
jgi:Trk K+ transport system NAD-binding subunit